MITRLVVVPGKVYLRDPHSPQASKAGRATASNIGFGYLATCKKAYAEGVALFYGENTFYLPAGGYEHTEEYFNDILQPHHRAMIRRFGIRLSLSDLDLSILDNIAQTPVIWRLEISHQLMVTWRKKASRAVGWWPYRTNAETGVLPTLEVEAIPGSEHVTADRSEDATYWFGQAGPDVMLPVMKSRAFVRGQVASKIRDNGWERTREWLLEEIQGGGKDMMD